MSFVKNVTLSFTELSLSVSLVSSFGILCQALFMLTQFISVSGYNSNRTWQRAFIKQGDLEVCEGRRQHGI